MRLKSPDFHPWGSCRFTLLHYLIFKQSILGTILFRLLESNVSKYSLFITVLFSFKIYSIIYNMTITFLFSIYTCLTSNQTLDESHLLDLAKFLQNMAISTQRLLEANVDLCVFCRNNNEPKEMYTSHKVSEIIIFKSFVFHFDYRNRTSYFTKKYPVHWFYIDLSLELFLF